MNWAAGITQKRPAFPVAIAMIAGILLHDHLPHRPVIYLGLASALLLAAMFTRPRLQRWFYILSCTALSGLAIAQLHAFFFAKDEIAQYTTDSQRLVWLEAQIDSPPRTFGDPFSKHRTTTLRQMMRAHVTSICTTDGWRPASGKIFLNTLDFNPELADGQKVRINGWLTQPTPAMNPGQFDWAGYCHRQGIYAIIFAPRVGDIEVIAQPRFNLLRSVREAARENLTRGFSETSALDHALLMDLLFGDNDSLLRQVHEDFREAGASHLLCISGLHIVILAWFVFQVCRILRLHPRWSALITAASLLLYGAAITPAFPAFRAIALALAYTTTLLLRRKVDSLHLLSAVAILLLVIDPLELYSPGFQLSFLTVAWLITAATPLMQYLMSFRDPDRVVAESFRPRTGISKLARSTMLWPIEGISGTLIAWSVTWPLVAIHFSQFNPLAVLGGIILAPLTFIAMIAGLLKILLTIIFPSAAHYFAGIAIAGSWLLRSGTSIFAHLPASHFPFATPGAFVLMSYYALMLAVLLPIKRWMRLASVGGCSLFLLLPFHNYFSPSTPPMKITLLSVGNGNCALVQPRDCQPILIDAGSLSFVDLDSNILEPFLQHEGISRLGAVILSSGNFDRISAVESLSQQQLVGQVLMSPHFQSQAYESYPAQRLLETLQILDIPVHLLTAGDRIPLNSTSEIQILWPPATANHSATDDGLALRITCNGKAVLFCGDAERNLLSHPQQIKSDILVAPHHGSADLFTQPLIATVSPQVIVSSNDDSLTASQREFEKLVGKRSLLRTNAKGAIVMTIDDAGKMNVEAAR